MHNKSQKTNRRHNKQAFRKKTRHKKPRVEKHSLKRYAKRSRNVKNRSKKSLQKGGIKICLGFGCTRSAAVVDVMEPRPLSTDVAAVMEPRPLSTAVVDVMEPRPLSPDVAAVMEPRPSFISSYLQTLSDRKKDPSFEHLYKKGYTERLKIIKTFAKFLLNSPEYTVKRASSEEINKNYSFLYDVYEQRRVVVNKDDTSSIDTMIKYPTVLTIQKKNGDILKEINITQVVKFLNTHLFTYAFNIEKENFIQIIDWETDWKTLKYWYLSWKDVKQGIANEEWMKEGNFNKEYEDVFPTTPQQNTPPPIPFQTKPSSHQEATTHPPVDTRTTLSWPIPYLNQANSPVLSSNSSASPPQPPIPNVLGEGMYGCIHEPSLVCEDVNIIRSYDGMVSKTLLNEDADKELEEYETIRRIDPSNNYHIGPPIKCKPRNTSYNITALQKCTKSRVHSKPIEKLSLLIMKNGGESIHDYAFKISTEKQIKNVLLSLEPLLQGLLLFKTEQIIHSDLKSKNVVYNPESKKSYFIDFGLMTRMNDPLLQTHWSYPLEIMHLDYSTFKEYVKKDNNDRKKIVLGKIYAVKNLIQHFIPTEDESWFIKEYTNFYTKYFDKLSEQLTLPTKDKRFLKNSFKVFKRNTIYTFDIYGMSIVFWDLLKVAKSFKPKPNFTDDLRSIARRMCHPDNSKRIQIEALIPLYKEFLDSPYNNIRRVT